MPSGLASSGELRYANELVAFIRETTGDWFHIEVACYPEYHPQTRNADDEMKNFKRKIDAGANSAITQYFYNADAYFRFVDESSAAGIDVPIVPGIMPIGNFSPARKVLGRLRRGNSALDARQARGFTATTRLPFAPSGSMS